MSIFSTGSVRICPDHRESRRLPVAWWLLTSRRWTTPLPINVYVIEHERGLVLFDTGQDRRSVTDPDYFPRGVFGLLFARLATFAIPAEETLTAGLSRLGYNIADVRVAVLSHLHQDHIGGLPELLGAEIVVSTVEWQQLSKPFPELNGLMAGHIDLPGLRWNHVDPVPMDGLAPFSTAHDLFGDGSLILLPTPGHTPGSLSLLLRQVGLPTMLFVGDLTYDVDLLSRGRVPGIGDRRGLERSSRMVERLRDTYPDLVVLAAHDPGAATALARAVG